MLCTIIRLESIVGTSQKTGNPYEIYTGFFAVQIASHKESRKTDHYVAHKSGYEIAKYQFDSPVYNKLHSHHVSNPFQPVDLEITRTFSEGGEERSNVEGFTVPKTADVKL